MDRRERNPDPEEVLRMALDGKQNQIWTALPGIVKSFNNQKHTCEVQPSIILSMRKQDGTFQDLKIPLLLDCPVIFPSGGGVTLTFPIQAGDEVLVVFSSRCIDSWWYLGGAQKQASFRMHDLSDGFVIPGPRSQPRVFAASATKAQLRTDDGAAYIELDPSNKHINVVSNSEVNVTAPVTTITGNVTITGTLMLAGINMNTHTHPDPQGGSVGGPQ